MRVYGGACPTVQMYINPPETDLLHRLLTALRWIACHGVFTAQVADRGYAFRLWIDAVNILNKQGLLSFFSPSPIKLSAASFINKTIITNKETTPIKFMILISLLSFGGLTPFLGLLPKWIAFQAIITNNIPPLATIVIVTLLITLYIYIYIYRERERERETDRQTERDRERERQRERERVSHSLPNPAFL